MRTSALTSTLTIAITGHGLADAKTIPRGHSCSVIVVVVVSVHALVRGVAPTRMSGRELQGLASQA